MSLTPDMVSAEEWRRVAESLMPEPVTTGQYPAPTLTEEQQKQVQELKEALSTDFDLLKENHRLKDIILQMLVALETVLETLSELESDTFGKACNPDAEMLALIAKAKGEI